jgi:predicted nucleic acid-binding protein
VALELFVDTSAWYPLVSRKHPDHPRMARSLKARVASGARVVTTNLVLAETHALLMSRFGPMIALVFLREVRSTPNEVVYSSAELEQQAEAWWLDRYRDQPLSLTDAVSFQVMTERGIREALTLDRHFSIAGFSSVAG